MKRNYDSANTDINPGASFPKNENGHYGVKSISTKTRDLIIKIISCYRNQKQLLALCADQNLLEICQTRKENLLEHFHEVAKGNPEDFATKIIEILLTNETTQHAVQSLQKPDALNSGQMHSRLADCKDKPRGKTLFLHAIEAGATEIAVVLVKKFGSDIVNDVARTEHPNPKMNLPGEYNTALHILIKALQSHGIEKFKELATLLVRCEVNISNNGFIKRGWNEILTLGNTRFGHDRLWSEAKHFLETEIKPAEELIQHEPINKQPTLEKLRWTPEKQLSPSQRGKPGMTQQRLSFSASSSTGTQEEIASPPSHAQTVSIAPIIPTPPQPAIKLPAANSTKNPTAKPSAKKEKGDTLLPVQTTISKFFSTSSTPSSSTQSEKLRFSSSPLPLNKPGFLDL